MKICRALKCESILNIIYCNLFAWFAFFNLGPYILWETFQKHSFFLVIYRLIQIGIVLIGGLTIFCTDIKKNDIFFACVSVPLVLFYEMHVYGDMSFALGDAIKAGIVFLFLLSNNKIKKKSFICFLNIFTLVLLPGIFVFFMNAININIPYTVLQPYEPAKIATGAIYKNYIFSIVLDSPLYSGYSIRRMCGLFNEPGVVGTICALLLIGNKVSPERTLKSKRNLLLILEGICSVSMAFFVLLGGYFLCICVIKNIKKSLLFFVIIPVAISLMIIVSTKSEFLNSQIINRFKIVDGRLAGNNRTSSIFEEEFGEFINHGNIIWGDGKGRSYSNGLEGSSSYKMLIMDYGFCGFWMLLFWILYGMILIGDKKIETVLGVFFFLLSIYQRPYVVNITFIVILFGGIMLQLENDCLNKEGGKDEKCLHIF